MADTMKAIVATEGEPLKLADVERPKPGPHEVLVKVAAAGLNRADLVQRAGKYPPPPGASEIMGLECSGTVIEVGHGVTRVQEGDEVCALLAGGGMKVGQVIGSTNRLGEIPQLFRSGEQRLNH